MADKEIARMMKRMFRTKRFWALALIFITILSASLVGRWSTRDVSAGAETYEKLKVFTEVLSVVRRNYVEETDTDTLVYDALKGMIRSLDPHSSFLKPDEYKEMQVDTRGEFGGLGIQISMKDGVLTVIEPIEDTPAWRAGVKSGDMIIKIEDEPTKDMTLQDAVSKMRGPKGSPVTISIMREGFKKPKPFTIVRDIIKVKSVKYHVMDDNVGYLKLQQFQERSADELLEAVKNLKKEKVGGLILDLRNNPGGLLTSAVDVTSQFLAGEKLVVYIKGRDGDKTEYLSNGKPSFAAKPMVVLVNQQSASASEIVAGALKDWKRATIIGMQSFGKGSVQSVIPLSDGSGLRLTTARYYTPRGTSIQNTGISPDIEVEIEAKDGTKSHPIIREKDLEGRLDNDQHSDAGPGGEGQETAVSISQLDEKDDTQLQKAREHIKKLMTEKRNAPARR
jgi:carboxyl-terminal processing protease